MSVIQFPAPLTREQRFCRARQAMLSELLGWVQSNPDPQAVANEVEGTCAAVRQLQQLQPLLTEPKR
jgi:hypothetical protein